ncbi:LacI family DNA-binding transcriptional regulator [Humibacter sp. RRB41]|uniref:LacI family DNA-binding transcriptional regulator n=1 Tax=Humibacter sp. RRB41 TaxID=2919946 RepID=UPI001FA9C286|nr:LacI family DNA-binding transcriptional regulator [Humibacter sp. RRB41]
MVTIADVAEEAGVSISTVSYVMSGKRTISPTTRQRVERAIATLGFSPHAGARSLASRSTNVIGLQIPLRSGVDVHVVMEVVTGVVAQARTHGYDILLLTSDDPRGMERAAKGSMVDALLVMDIESDDPRIGVLTHLEQPTVLIGLPEGRRTMPCVDFDFEEAGWLAVDRLLAQGHRRLALIGSPAEVLARHTSYADRLARGFLAACAAANVVGSVHACPSSADATAVVDEVVAADPSVTGFLVHNESALPHVFARLVETGKHSSAKPGIVALCPEDVALSVPGPVDSIAVPAEAIGSAAADVICDMIAGGTPPGVRLIAPTLTVRTSTDVVATKHPSTTRAT